jgi:plastocyanin
MSRLGVLGLGAVAALLVAVTAVRIRPDAGTAYAADTWQVQAGGDIAAESITGNGFFPNFLTIRVGDTVQWNFRGFHTVTFNAGRPPLDLIVPGPGPGDLAFGPALFPYPPAETPPTGPYDGTTQVSSGVPLEGEPQPFTLTFTRAGIFPYVCMVHSGMNGTVMVLPETAQLAETPAQAAARGEAEFQAALAALKSGVLPLVQAGTTPGPGGITVRTLAAGVSYAGGMSALQFVPADLTVRRGDVVVWTNSDPFELHTVTFLSGAPTPAEIEIEARAAGPPLVYFPARVAGPAGGTTYTGQGYVNSGLMFAGNSYTLTITAPPGTYEYICLIHSGAVAEMGGTPPMKGRIIVTE